ncbi:hypothetical protein HPB50_015486 [Hyalomma asiaticum]|uniref:Uncharacterized protein n=1 Tax=Hyalomma asiaticum TaxID=266040 RepID=A0ACB7S0I4_HYAAI|nr:hypothetical protein HPB50_015486 [Hyalomma asiaticum]
MRRGLLLHSLPLRTTFGAREVRVVVESICSVIVHGCGTDTRERNAPQFTNTRHFAPLTTGKSSSPQRPICSPPYPPLRELWEILLSIPPWNKLRLVTKARRRGKHMDSCEEGPKTSSACAAKLTNKVFHSFEEGPVRSKSARATPYTCDQCGRSDDDEIAQ